MRDQEGAGHLGTERTSPDGRYRYLLGRRWAAGPAVLWVLANPSTADAGSDDPTLRRCVAFARAHGAGALLVANLRAHRSTDPRGLLGVTDPVGPGNDAAIRSALAASSGPVVVAWGVQRDPARVRAVLDLLGERPTHCLGTTRDGHPRHPLYVPGSTRLRPWSSTGRVSPEDVSPSAPAEVRRTASAPRPRRGPSPAAGR